MLEYNEVYNPSRARKSPEETEHSGKRQNGPKYGVYMENMDKMEKWKSAEHFFLFHPHLKK